MTRFVPEDLLTGELLHNVWVLSGRPDPFGHDGDAWIGFAMAIRAALGMARIPPDLRQRLATTSGSASDSAAANTGSVVNVGDGAPGYSEGGG